MDFSYTQLFSSGGEFFGFITGILSVLLLVFTRYPRLQWLAWPAGVLTAAAYLILFYQWGLFGNAVLQIPFFVVSIVGAWTWRGQLRGIVTNVKELPTTFSPRSTFFRILGVAALGLCFFLPVLSYMGDVAPLWDGLILVLSLSAFYLQLRKRVDSWYLWIAVDLVAIPLHFLTGHGATGLLYATYLAMCVFGLVAWRREARRVRLAELNRPRHNRENHIRSELEYMTLDFDPQDQRSMFA